MEKVTRELARIRRQGWSLLVAQRVAQVLAAAAVLVVALGMLDYLLRLPGWMRLIVGVAAVAGLVAWAGPRLARAYRFWPELGELALRAERVMPDLAGRLASAVEFSLNPRAYALPDAPPATAALAGASVGGARGGVDPARLGRIIDPAQTRRSLLLAALASVVLLAIVVAAPAHAALAAQRWLAPLGGAEWPRRVHVADLTDAGVRPADASVRLAAAIERGYLVNMRVWAHYRIEEPGATTRWTAVLMSEQLSEADPAGRGHFERLVDLPEHLASGLAGRAVSLEYYLEAGDHRTEPRQIELVERPRVTALRVHVTPPAYADGLIEPRWLELGRQGGAVASVAALLGSELRVRVELNKPLPVDEGTLSQALPGLAGRATLIGTGAAGVAGVAGEAPYFEAVVTLDDTLETTIELEDEHGLASHSERRYRVEALEDQPPIASLLAPDADEAVMPRATVDLASRARDDVGLAGLSLRAEVHRPGRDQDRPERRTLADVAGRRAELTLDQPLELASLDVEPGDTVAIYAEARDVYDRDGERHEPVQSVQRHLQIIGESELIDAIRRELAAVRQQAVRLQQQQAELTERDPADTLAGQRQIADRAGAQRSVIDRLDDRAERNRLEDPALEQMLDRAGGGG
ncbi:MAG: hypothetical protein WD009_02460, partial [Phycisphaeraceae bacterium]